ncbi:MAG TPA: AbrB/MazE/SpoVT family DNA-binding domain-containing protein [Microvirga sp.]|jgi:AbrB family looped-hinge helix DNA binding protein|nr:AbrB/MazE/SpoVT family DNA-binding domain-containing protein [Microvirga sp.]
MSYIGRSAITSKGQITIPSAMRERFGLAPGDDVEFFEGSDGSIKVRFLRRSAASLIGRLKHLKPDPRYSDDDAAIADEVMARDERSKAGGR